MSSRAVAKWVCAVLTVALVGCGGYEELSELQDQLSEETAQEGDLSPGKSFRDALDRLKLDATQRGKVCGLVQQMRSKATTVKKVRRQLALELAKGIEAGQLDHVQLGQLAQQMQGQVQTMRPHISKFLKQLHAILTPEQRKALANAHDKARFGQGACGQAQKDKGTQQGEGGIDQGKQQGNSSPQKGQSQGASGQEMGNQQDQSGNKGKCGNKNKGKCGKCKGKSKGKGGKCGMLPRLFKKLGLTKDQRMLIMLDLRDSLMQQNQGQQGCSFKKMRDQIKTMQQGFQSGSFNPDGKADGQSSCIKTRLGRVAKVFGIILPVLSQEQRNAMATLIRAKVATWHKGSHKPGLCPFKGKGAKDKKAKGKKAKGKKAKGKKGCSGKDQGSKRWPGQAPERSQSPR